MMILSTGHMAADEDQLNEYCDEGEHTYYHEKKKLETDRCIGILLDFLGNFLVGRSLYVVL